jgi:cellulose synthase (UDP-forming)
MTLSLRMQGRFQRRSAIRLIVAIIYVFLVLVYLTWRTTTFNPSSLILSYLFYAADFIGGILGLTAIYVSWSYYHRVPPAAPPGLSVDVFIPVYKESIDIIRQTVIAAKAIDYPHGTWVLDDSGRQDIRLIADEFGCH